MMRAVAVPLLLGLALAACGGATPPGATGSGGGTGAGPSASGASPSGHASGQPSASAVPGTTAPAGSPSTAPTDSGTPASEPPAESALPEPSASTGAVLPCRPEGDNPSFWPSLVGSVTWRVYCAVLPDGWFVASGSFRLANGGKLLITYRGPGGASLALSEGSFCADGGDCVPSGHDAGAAVFGREPGTLVAVDAGGYAIVAARGQTPSWLMVTTGLDQATAVSLGAGLAALDR